MSTKSYLLDTSVILDDIQNIVYLYQDGANALFLSDTIIDELDKKKELMNEMGYFVREFFRNLYTPEESSTTTESQQFQGIDSDNVCARSGGSGGLAPTADNKFAQQTCSKNNDYIRQIYFIHNAHHIPITLIYRPHYEIPHQDHSLNDTKIITIAKDYNLTLLTNDISLKIRALTQNLNAQSLFRDRVENPEKIDFWQSFEIHKDENLSSLEANEGFGKLKNWSLLELIELDNTDSSMYRTGKKSFGFKIDGKCEIANLDEIISENKPYITPANLEQKMLYAMLLHPKNLISIVTGATGSGKTLIALQAGLSLLKNGDVEGIIYLRNTVTATDKEAELGFRKGDESQKLSYFMYPLYSAINCMIDKLQQGSLAKRIEYRGEVKSIEKMEATEYFLQKHKIEVLDIAHARGITIANKFIIFDEVQNASNATIKLIGTRVGEGSRIVFLGDWAQIDHPYLSKFRNGALSLLQKATSDDMIAAMQLRQTIRSDIARWFGDFE